DESRLDLPELQRAVEELAKAMALATAAEPAQLIDGATQAGELRAMEELLAAQDAGFGWRLEALRRSLASGWSQAVDAVVADARKLTEEGAQLVRHLDLGVLDADIGALREGLDRARNSFFLFRKGKVRAAKAMVAPWLSDPEATPERVSAALGVAQRVQTLGARLVKQLGDLLGVAPEARAYVTDGALAGRLNEFLQALGRGRDLLLKGGPELAHLVELPADVRDRLRTRARWLADGWERLGRACRVDAAVFGAWQAGRPVVACVGAAIKDWQLAAQRGAFLPLLRWCRVLATYRALHEAGLDKVVEAVKDGSLAPQDAATAVERSLAKACMEERLATTGLGRFDGASYGVEVGKYVTLNEGRSFLLTEVLPQRMLGKRPWKPGQRFGQVAELYSQELNRQKGGRSIRALLSEFPDAIMALTPCVLASPESVAQFLSIKKLRFDIVVFDEASQVPVAEAIGAIARGRSLVVVGDSRQMPPTAFFARGKVSDEAEGSAVAVEETVDLESILTEVAENAGLPRLWLSWHYRSQDESLIAFSNRHYYEDKLASFPAPSSQLDGMGVSLIEVTDGVFDSGETRTNEAEARAVLEEVLRRVRDPREAKRSIGIVTMNLQQADLMRELLEEAAADEPGLQAILDSEEEDSLFIKNLENVQGDERDVIIISLTYAKNREGRLAMNFGPLNRLGGERRWNVLVTRARQQVVVVSSMQPEEIRLQDVSRLAKGVHHMRAYLEMAKRGADRGQVSRLRIAEAVDLHRDQIAAALRQLGWTVDVGVGLSSFKVDLAIAHPDHGERRVAAILLDGPGYAKRRTVQDRDGLPAAVLRQMMKWPTVLRVWLPEWVLERERVLDQLHAAIQAAKQGVDERLSAAAEGAASEFVAVGSGKADAVGEPKPQWGSAPGGFKPKKSEPVTPAAAVDPEPTAPAALRSNGVDDVSQVSATPVQHRDPEDLDYVAYPGGVVLGTKENLSPGCSGLVQNAIRKAIDDVLAVEAPIRIDLLAKHVARRFGLSKVHSDRAQVVIDLVDRALVSKSLGETFVWSRQVEAATWRAFRRTTEAFRKDRQL
ncbi:MAG: hypothetical protein RL398_2724, partial [Planctomycetota bacterium]